MNLILEMLKASKLYRLVAQGLVLPQIDIYLDNGCCEMCEKSPINLKIWSVLAMSNAVLNVLYVTYLSSEASRAIL